MKPRIPSIVLLSGGLDSAANLALCAENDYPLLALTFCYGQKSQTRELSAAQKLAEFYGVAHDVIHLPWLGGLGGSALTDPTAEIPNVSQSQLDDLRVTLATGNRVWVPNRNGVFIQAAAAVAERRSAHRVVLGFNREEAATFPDNSRDFMERATHALALSTANQVEAFSYTVDMDKREIVQRLRQLSRPFPFQSLWSCYFGGPQACGQCESCQRLARALATA